MTKPKYQYFKTLELAQKAAQKYEGQVFTNSLQMEGDCTTVKVVEFGRGFTIQFGDCGPYLERDTK